MQWNILYKEKAENIIALLNSVKPDIFCFQELCIDSVYNPGIRDIARYIAEKLGVRYYFETAFTKPDAEEVKSIGNAVFSRFPIVGKRHFFTKEAGSHVTDFSDEGRVYVEAEIQTDEQKFLQVGTVHLSYIHKFMMTEAKIKEVNRLVDGVKDKSKSYILTGDLNSTPDSYAIQELQKYFINAGPPFDEPTWTTKPFDHRGFREKSLRWRLDYIFVTKDIRIVSSEIIKTDYSDHLPILLTFDF